MNPTAVDRIIHIALEEDIGCGDRTTACLVPEGLRADAVVVAKQELVLSGTHPFARVFQLLSPEVETVFQFQEGAVVQQAAVVAQITGHFNILLAGERTALNFLQRLSGISTLTRLFAEKVKPFGVVILDTRKTTPGHRVLEKHAVKMGGGQNHRMGLFDAMLIKENHIAACGGVTPAVRKAKSAAGPNIFVEVEVKSLDELTEAIEARADMVMLDNMTVETVQKAVDITDKRIPLEVSGNVTLDTVVQIAQTGIDYISVGAITHSAPVADLSMLINPQSGSSPAVCGQAQPPAR